MVNLVKYFAIAIVSFTRIPLPALPKRWFDPNQNKSMALFPLIGGLIGLVTWGIWTELYKFIPLDILTLIILVIPIVLTGAYHEDGFADTCDSYGGYTKDKMLKIMKDSRIGTFAAIGLIFLLLSKYLFLKDISVPTVPLALASALILGRLCAMLPFRLYPYAGKTSATASMLAFSGQTLLTAFTIAFIFLDILIGLKTSLLLIIAVQIPVLLLGSYFNHRLGGLTGDTGGAMEQVGELITLFIFVLLSNGAIHI